MQQPIKCSNLISIGCFQTASTLRRLIVLTAWNILAFLTSNQRGFCAINSRQSPFHSSQFLQIKFDELWLMRDVH